MSKTLLIGTLVTPIPIAAVSVGCKACRDKRCHTNVEWRRFHPLAGHGFTPETGWTHPEAERLNKEEAAARKTEILSPSSTERGKLYGTANAIYATPKLSPEAT